MAYARMKALENYLEQCKGLDNFTEILEKQCVQLVREIEGIAKLDLEEAAPLLALVQQNKLWTNELRSTIAKALQSKVSESLRRPVMVNRTQLQDFTWFPMYLTMADWNQVMGETMALGQKCQLVMERLWKLGLQAPSEPTYAMLTTVLLLTDSARFSDSVQLRSSYLHVKGLAKGYLKS